ncbi:hypothetical protein HMPREF9205_0070 [Cutibacterium acnes SK182]|nr:hypothetical protein HMPREF9205_0070 [Cutibacterium acnes SK182]
MRRRIRFGGGLRHELSSRGIRSDIPTSLGCVRALLSARATVMS